MLWERLKKTLAPKTDREFSVKVQEVETAIKEAKLAETNILEQLAQLNLALKHGRK